ncbi:MAG: flagellar basal body rod protein FlgC [Roseburia sp.]|nr:flagellar basal body rod protein FlgC [Roseburia sp.]
MGIFDSFDISASGMSAERFRMDIISQNLANVNTTRTEDGTPYVRKVVTFQEKTDARNGKFSTVLNNVCKGAGGAYGSLGSAKLTTPGIGVKVGGIYEDTWTPEVLTYEPEHPDADENGYVHSPNVSIITEMTNMIDASRGYDANRSAFDAAKKMALKGLEMN